MVAVVIAGTCVDAGERGFGKMVAIEGGGTNAVEPGGFQGDDRAARAKMAGDIGRGRVGVGVEGDTRTIAWEEVIVLAIGVDGPDDGLVEAGNVARNEASDTGGFAEVEERHREPSLS